MLVRVYKSCCQDGQPRDWCTTWDFKNYDFVTECKYNVLAAIAPKDATLFQPIFGPYQKGLAIVKNQVHTLLQLLLQHRPSVSHLKSNYRQFFDAWITALEEAGADGCVVID